MSIRAAMHSAAPNRLDAPTRRISSGGHMKADAINGKGLKRRDLLLGGTSLAAASTLPATRITKSARAQPAQPPAVAPALSGAKRPSILVIFGDDIRQSNISAYTLGLMGYGCRTSTASLVRG
jgi:hypothetical protein